MAIGVALGDFTAMTLSMLGVGALLATSAMLFTALKWIGAAYLIWLGIKLWQAGGSLDASPRTDKVTALKMLSHAWLVTALNPKGITFFVAFLPQFLNPNGDLLTQMTIFEVTFLVLGFSNVFGYTLIASRARKLVQSSRAISVFNKAGGTLLIGAGIVTAAAHRTQNGAPVSQRPAIARDARGPEYRCRWPITRLSECNPSRPSPPAALAG